MLQRTLFFVQDGIVADEEERGGRVLFVSLDSNKCRALELRVDRLQVADLVASDDSHAVVGVEGRLRCGGVADAG